MHEGQRDEFRETTRAVVEISRCQNVGNPVFGVFDASEHDRDVRPQPERMRRFVDHQPLVRRHLVRTQDRPHVIVQDLRGRPRQRCQSCFLHPREVRLEGLTESARAFQDFERRESVHVHGRDGFLHQLRHPHVVIAVEVRVNSTLQTHLGCPTGRCLHNSGNDFLIIEKVRASTQVQRQRTLGETAEGALVCADIRVVDVAVTDEGDRVAIGVRPQLVREFGYRRHLATPGRKQDRELVSFDPLPRTNTVEHFADGTANGNVLRNERGRCPIRSRVPGAGPASDLNHLGTRSDVDGVGIGLREHRPGVIPGQTLGVASIQNGEVQTFVQPTMPVARELRIDGEPWCQLESARRCRVTQSIQSRPRAFRVHVVRRYR